MTKKILGIALLIACLLACTTGMAATFDFEDGADPGFIQSGDCALSVADFAHSGSYSLLVGKRTTNNWDAADYSYEALGIQGGDTVAVSFWAYSKADKAGNIGVGNAGGNYADLIVAEIQPETWTFVEGEFVVGEEPVNLRFKTNDDIVGADYYIDDVVIDVADPTMTKTVAATFDFEDAVDPGFIQSGTSTISVTDTAAFQGAYSLLVGQRTTNNWDAADYSYEALGIQAGDTVKVSFWALVKGTEAGVIGVGNAGGDYADLVTAEIAPEVWTRVAGEFVVGETPVNLRFKGNDALIGADYYIDNVKVEILRPAVTTLNYAYDFEDGENPGFFQSGTATIAVADVDGGKAIEVSQRTTNDWDSTDFPFDVLGLSSGDTVKVSFKAYHKGSELGQIQLGNGGGNYATLVAADVEPLTWTEIAGEFVVEDPINLRFKTDATLIGADYYIDDLAIAVVKPYLIKYYSNDIEGGIDAFVQSGTCSVEDSTAIFNSEATSVGSLRRTTNDWDALDILVEAIGAVPGDMVNMSFYLYADTVDEGDWGLGNGGGNYATLMSATVPGKTWTKIGGSFELAEVTNLRFKSMSENMLGVDFYVDDIQVEYYSLPADPDADIITAEAYGPSDANYDLATVYEMANGTTFQMVWNGTHVFTKLTVLDATVDSNDYVQVFADGMSKKVKRTKGEEIEGGYVLYTKNVCPGEAGDKFKFDVVVVDQSGESISWAGSEVLDTTELHEYGRVLLGPVE